MLGYGTLRGIVLGKTYYTGTEREDPGSRIY